MKYYPTTFALALLTLLSCETNTPHKPPPPCRGIKPDGSPCYSLPLSEALDGMARYDVLLNQLESLEIKVDSLQDKLDSLTKKPAHPHRKRLKSSLKLRGFTIRSADLLEALGLDAEGHRKKVKHDYVRVYLGLDKSDHFKMFLTPVEGANLDTIPAIAGRDVPLKKKKKVNGQDVDEEYVLDFAMPCPNTCPDNPLYAY